MKYLLSFFCFLSLFFSFVEKKRKTTEPIWLKNKNKTLNRHRRWFDRVHHFSCNGGRLCTGRIQRVYVSALRPFPLSIAGNFLWSMFHATINRPDLCQEENRIVRGWFGGIDRSSRSSLRRRVRCGSIGICKTNGVAILRWGTDSTEWERVVTKEHVSMLSKRKRVNREGRMTKHSLGFW